MTPVPPSDAGKDKSHKISIAPKIEWYIRVSSTGHLILTYRLSYFWKEYQFRIGRKATITDEGYFVYLCTIN
jgi:hypothetical protein